MIPNEKKKPDKIIHVGNREFRLFRYYDESLGEELIDYPNFQENPEYTGEGRPFVLAIQECCLIGKSDDIDDPDPGDCSGCVWFYLEAPDDAIGICMCDVLRRESKEEPR